MLDMDCVVVVPCWVGRKGSRDLVVGIESVVVVDGTPEEDCGILVVADYEIPAEADCGILVEGDCERFAARDEIPVEGGKLRHYYYRPLVFVALL
jgi:hypothetical protein